MASLNTRTRTPAEKTHEGAKAAKLDEAAQLRRSVMACLLWEDSFYEDGISIPTRIVELASKRPPEEVAALAVKARQEFHLRHVPLLLLTVLMKTGAGPGKNRIVERTFPQVIQRADEMAEFISIYWKDGKRPLSAQAKRGIAASFANFDAYQLAKYKGSKDAVSLRDVMFLVHPKPTDKQKEDFEKLANGKLEAPDTWEVELSAGGNKKETFERLLSDGRLGYMALLRNLRGMVAANVDEALIRSAILQRKGAQNVLPFRYIAALRAAPSFAKELDVALQEAVSELPVLDGKTMVLVDVSGSMSMPLSTRSDMDRIDAAAALAAIVRAENKRIFSFSDRLVEVPAFDGLACVEAIKSSQPHSSTNLAEAVNALNVKGYDRIVVITDEQALPGRVTPRVGSKAYILNVAAYKNGIGSGDWVRIDGWSDSVIRYITEAERESTLEEA